MHLCLVEVEKQSSLRPGTVCNKDLNVKGTRADCFC